MIDPITIIGLAASVVQVVDVTGRLVSKSIEIYQSSSGALQENIELEKIVSDLQCTNAKLAKFPLQLGPGNVIDPADKAIRELCCGCNEVADELLGKLEKLKLDTGKDELKKLKSFKYALKSAWTKKELDALYARVVAYKDQMEMRILVALAYVLIFIIHFNANTWIGSVSIACNWNRNLASIAWNALGRRFLRV